VWLAVSLYLCAISASDTPRQVVSVTAYLSGTVSRLSSFLLPGFLHPIVLDYWTGPCLHSSLPVILPNTLVFSLVTSIVRLPIWTRLFHTWSCATAEAAPGNPAGFCTGKTPSPSNEKLACVGRLAGLQTWLARLIS
jgi:hypothetical protein